MNGAIEVKVAVVFIWLNEGKYYLAITSRNN